MLFQGIKYPTDIISQNVLSPLSFQKWYKEEKDSHSKQTMKVLAGHVYYV